jgi:hypothetical protein
VYEYRDTTKEEHGIVIKQLIIRAAGMATGGSNENLEAIPEKNSIDSLQKTAIL